MLLRISVETEFNIQEITRSLLRIQSDSCGEIASGFACVPSMNPSFSFAERAMDTDLLH